MVDESSSGRVRKRWAWQFGLATLLIALTAVGVGLAWWRYQHNRHSAVALVRLRFSPGVLDFRQFGPPREDYEMFCGTQIELMSSSPILAKAADDLTVNKPVLLNGVTSPPEFLREHLQIERLPNSELVSLRFTASTPNPNEVKDALTSICAAYVSANEFTSIQESQRVVSVLRDEVASLRSTIQKLHESRTALRLNQMDTIAEYQIIETELKIEEKAYELMRERLDLWRMMQMDQSRVYLVVLPHIEQ